MAEKLGVYLEHVLEVNPADVAILSSPLQRCVQTADGIVRGLLTSFEKRPTDIQVGTVPIFLEPCIVEGAYWMNVDMRKNPAILDCGVLLCPQPLLQNATFHHTHTSPHVQTNKPFSLKHEPQFSVVDNLLVEMPEIGARCAMAAEALLQEPFLDGKTVILVGHGETVRCWLKAFSVSSAEVAANPPYTGLAYLKRETQGDSTSQWMSMCPHWDTPHLSS